jgi:DNA replication protein DnaC
MTESDGSAPLTDADFAEQLKVAELAQQEARKRLQAESGPPQAAPARVGAIGMPTFPVLSNEQAAELEAEQEKRAGRDKRDRLRERLASLPRGFTLRFGKDEAWTNQEPWRSFPEVVSISRSLGGAVNLQRAVWVGAAGVGKTSLAVAALALWAESNDRGILFCSSRELSIARARSPLGDSEPPLVARAMTADLLLLDDLGDEQIVPLSAVPDVIHKRHLDGLPTWVTTWCRDTDLIDRYGAGITRRVYDRALVMALR